MRWIHVDPHLEQIESQGIVESLLYAQRQGLSPKQESKKRFPISYALAAEHVPVSGGLRARVTDVTPRYAFSWTDSLKQRGVLRGKQTKLTDSERADIWLSATLKSINGGDRKKIEELRSKGKHVEDAIVLDDDDDDAAANGGNNTTTSADQQQMEDIHNNEMDELKASAKDEPMPTSKTAFKSHPIYVIPSVMNTNEVLVPDAKKRVCGIFKGELVFRRVDVETALAAKRWLYKGRKVKRDELRKPILRVKARKKPASSGFKALKSYGVGASNDGSAAAQEKQIAAASRPLNDDNNDGMEDLYASWQTDPWSPAPVGPGDRIPVSRHNNIELELLNPGLVHIDEERIAVVAKQLGIPYAPCLLGFEGHAGNRTPTIRGIVVHEHNAELLREAHMEMASQRLEQSHENHQKEVYKKWKRLLIGVLTKDRLERAYGDDDE